MTDSPLPGGSGFPFEGELIVILPEEWDLLCATRTVREWIDKHGTLDVTPENEDALALLAGLHDQEAEAWRVLKEIPMEVILAHQEAHRKLVLAARQWNVTLSIHEMLSANGEPVHQACLDHDRSIAELRLALKGIGHG